MSIVKEAMEKADLTVTGSHAGKYTSRKLLAAFEEMKTEVEQRTPDHTYYKGMQAGELELLSELIDYLKEKI